jgi:hypothetical protein
MLCYLHLKQWSYEDGLEKAFSSAFIGFISHTQGRL